MTYPAPRQGAFAVIILISFCLTLLAFVMISEQSWQQRQDEAAHFIANQIATDSSLPITIHDQISLSVLADKHLVDGVIGFVGFYDDSGAPLVTVGSESVHAVQMNIQQGNTVLGSVKVTGTPISRAKIIADSWLFVMASLVLHSLLWLLYGYLARPNKHTIDDIAKITRDRLVAQGILESLPNKNNNPPLSAKNVSDYLKSQQPSALSEFDTAHTEHRTHNEISFKQKVAQADAIVMIAFDDNHDFLQLVADDLSVPYFVLCNEMLERCLHQLLQLPNFANVRVVAIDKFTKSGACIYLANTSEDGRAALAAAMLAKMIPIANKIIYDKHRDIRKFALPMRALATNRNKAANAKSLLRRYNEPSLLFMDADAAKSISAVMNLIAPKKPSSIHERECRFIGDVSDTLSSQLQKMIIKAFTTNETSHTTQP